MPARVVLVHDEQEFLEEAETAIRAAGHDVVAFSRSMAALRAGGHRDDRATDYAGEVFAGNTEWCFLSPHGPNEATGYQGAVHALPEMEEHAGDLGAFMPAPINIAELVEAIARMLGRDAKNSTPTWSLLRLAELARSPADRGHPCATVP